MEAMTCHILVDVRLQARDKILSFKCEDGNTWSIMATLQIPSQRIARMSFGEVVKRFCREEFLERM